MFPLMAGRMVRVFKSNGSGFETQAAGDACRIPRKEVGMDALDDARGNAPFQRILLKSHR